jgi:hypothetical protein
MPRRAKASVTDPDARLYRKGEGKEAKLCYIRKLAETTEELVQGELFWIKLG